MNDYNENRFSEQPSGPSFVIGGIGVAIVIALLAWAGNTSQMGQPGASSGGTASNEQQSTTGSGGQSGQ